MKPPTLLDNKGNCLYWATLHGEEVYLCKADDKWFVSSVKLLPKEQLDITMTQNHEKGCLYVDSGKRCIPVEKLDEIYLIREARNNEAYRRED